MKETQNECLKGRVVVKKIAQTQPDFILKGINMKKRTYHNPHALDIVPHTFSHKNSLQLLLLFVLYVFLPSIENRRIGGDPNISLGLARRLQEGIG